jgi:hypothetical protein
MERLHVHNGQRVLRASDRLYEKVLREMVESTPGATIQLVAEVFAPRTVAGLGAASAAIKNTLGREQRAEIWVVGTQEQTDKQLKDVAMLLNKMESRGFASDGSCNVKLTREDGTLNRRELPREDGQPSSKFATMNVRDSDSFSNFTAVSKEAVAARYRYIEERKEARDAGQEDKAPAKDASKDAGNEAAAKRRTARRLMLRRLRSRTRTRVAYSD